MRNIFYENQHSGSQLYDSLSWRVCVWLSIGRQWIVSSEVSNTTEGAVEEGRDHRCLLELCTTG